MGDKIKKLTLSALCVASALILSYVEAMLPPIFAAIPGIKVGLANIVVIFLLYNLGLVYALPVSLIRVALAALLFGSPMSFIYSLSGALFSIGIMFAVKKLGVFTPVGLSVLGGVAHNLGQILAAVLLLSTPQIAYYMIPLLISGTLAGIAVGLVSALLIKRIRI